MEKEVKSRGRKKAPKLTPQANDIKLRIINLHAYDLKEIDHIEFRMKDGGVLVAGFHNTPVEEPLTSDDKVYIRFVETKPYYNRYQLMYKSSLYETQDFELGLFINQEKFAEGNHNPNYTYEF